MDTDNDMQPPIEADAASTKSYKARGLTIGLAAGLLGGTAAGLVFGVPGLSSAAAPSAVIAQTDDTTPVDTTPDSAPTDSTDPAAPAPTDEQAPPEAGTRLRDALQPLVDDGTITAEQADAVAAQLKDSLPGRGGRMGSGTAGHRGGGEFGRMLGREFGEASDVVTGVLGIDADTLRTELLDGKSLADIATANGVDPQAVVDALVAEANTRIDEAVTDGKIDADRAAEMKAELADRMTDVVNGTLPDFGDFSGHRGHHGEDGDPSTPTDDSTAPVTTDN